MLKSGRFFLTADKINNKIEDCSIHSRTDACIQYTEHKWRKETRGAQNDAEADHAGHDNITLDIEKCKRAYLPMRESRDAGGMISKQAEKNNFEKKKENNACGWEREPYWI